ncbi:MAG: hypothetical protein KBF76_13315 [Verrucomicrobiales bacterium]|jgi:hypothetical protein|nr:hypothetical protein [Verrucomicrobiales bacterium]HQZ28606.1 hypothetical protein [Verrucomicrobiales bacterium]
MPDLSRIEDPTPQSCCRFALAFADITPPSDIYHRMWGAARHERATGVHRPLRATVAIFAPLEGADRQILLALDHCVMGATEHANLIAQTATISGVAEEEILVVFSHTHGAGLMGLDRALLPGGDRIPPYLEHVGDTAGALVKQCLASLVPARIVYGKGTCALGTHRDFWDGSQFICGHNPGVPVDDTVIVARVTADDETTLATVVNYACHPTTLAWENTLISPDYPGAMRELIEHETGAPCLFLQGASGEIGPREGFVGDSTVADRNGRELGFAALSILTALPKAGTNFVYAGPVVSGATLGAWKHVPLSSVALAAKADWRRERWHEPLPFRPGQSTVAETEEALEQMQSDEAKALSSGDEARAAEYRALAERKTRLLHRLRQLPQGDHYPLQVVVWQIGDAFWIGVQGESYSLLQTELRRRFPDKTLIIASIAADWGASYLTPRELYDTGIYQESIAVVVAGSLEQLIESISLRLSP